MVLIPKGGVLGAADDPAAYRPICLLDTLGKLYEQLIKGRLECELEDRAVLSDRQYGFRRGRGTIHAVERVVEVARRSCSRLVVLVTLDIKNAFNTASWGVIRRRMREIGVSGGLVHLVDQYLEEREIKMGGDVRMELSAGVPQGSVLGPTLWNILYDPVLRLGLPRGCQTVAFADDLALLVEAEGRLSLSTRLEYALDSIRTWMTGVQLELAVHKTEALVMRGPRNREGVVFDLFGSRVAPSRSLRYLGVHLDSQGTFGAHVVQATSKADRTVSAMMRIMPNVGGPGTMKRLALCGVVHSIILYGAPIWAKAMLMRKYREMVTGAQRRALLRAACAYRTVSAEALQVVTGVLPIDIMVRERATLHETGNGNRPDVRKEAREVSMREWQHRWEGITEKAQWTKRLLPNVVQWVRCEHRATDYALTQFLTGHGCFRSYTRRIGRADDDRCIYCGGTDTVEHTFIHCGRWAELRAGVRASWGEPFDIDSIARVLPVDRNKFSLFRSFSRDLIREKEREERERQTLELR